MDAVDAVWTFLKAYVTVRLADALLAAFGAFPLCWAVQLAHTFWLHGLPLLGFWAAFGLIFLLRMSGLIYADYGDD